MAACTWRKLESRTVGSPGSARGRGDSEWDGISQPQMHLSRSDSKAEDVASIGANPALRTPLECPDLRSTQDYAHQIAFWRQQEGVAQTIAINEREQYLRYHAIIEASLDNLGKSLENEDLVPEEFRPSVRDQIRSFKSDRFNLAEQARTLRCAESKLLEIRYRMSEIDKSFGIETTSPSPGNMYLADLESEFCKDQNAPQVVQSYFERLQEINVTEDRLTELAQDSDSAGRVGSQATASDWYRLIAMKARLDSLQQEATLLKSCCLATGFDPEHFRWHSSVLRNQADTDDSDLDFDIITFREIQSEKTGSS